MRPVLTIAAWQMRRGWRALALLSLAVALTAGFVMTAATGARRTASAWTRMRQDTLAPDIEGFTERPDDLKAALRARPDVVAIGQYAWMFVYPVLDGDLPAEGMYVALSDSYGRDTSVPVIVEGRAADPARADELTINEALAGLTGLRPGDRVELRSRPEAVTQAAAVVGIHRGTRDLNEDAGLISGLLTPAFGRRWFAPYRDAFVAQSPNAYPTAVIARFAPGTDLDGVVAELSTRFPDPSPVRVDDDSTALGDTLGAQRTAYTLLAGIGGVGALAALGQAVTRLARRSAEELAVLSVLGLTGPQRLLAVVGAPLAACAAGALAAPLIAYAGSGTIPSGLARRVDPTPGRHADLVVGVLGVPAIVLLLGLVSVAGAWRVGHRAQVRVAPGRLKAPTASPARLFGFRVAGGWATRGNRITARSQVLGVVAAATLLTAVGTWSAGVRHVSTDAGLWGTTWGATIGVNEDSARLTDFQTAEDVWPAVSDLGERLATDASLVTSVAAVQVGSVTVDKIQVEVATIENRRGTIWPPLLQGRAARAPDEVDAGRDFARRTGWKLGDSRPAGAATVRLVGEVVAPQLGNGEFGQTIVTSPEAVERMGGFDLLNSSYLFVDLAPGVSKAALAEEIGDLFEIVDPSPPSPVFSVGAIGGIDELLIAFISAIGTLAAAHGVRGAARQRRRDHAVLRALGARPRLIASATAWQTACTVGLGALVGIPTGWLVGRVVWSRTARGMGVVVGYPSPIPVLTTTAAATLAVGATVAAALGAMAARASSTRLLRQE